MAFLLTSELEAFYGGAAGGGKSSALLLAALQYANVPGYAALILRRTYADLSLPGAIMDRADAWLSESDAHWNGQEKTWTFPSGASLTFGYLDTERDKFRYQGAEFQFVGFDELTQFTETMYLYLLSRVRRKAGVAVPLRIRGAANPGGLGHEWVKARFVTDAPDCGRPFIPAKLTDNPHLDQESYRASLARMDDITRGQLEDGNWDILPAGDLFSRAWFVPQLDPYVPQKRVRSWDLAATAGGGDYTVGVRLCRTMASTYVVEDIVRGQWDVGERDEIIKRTAALDGQTVDIIIEEEGGSSGKYQTAGLAKMLAGYVVNGERSTGPKDVRARTVASQVKVGNVRHVLGAWNSAYINELVSLPKGAHDDIVDAASGAFNTLSGTRVVSAHGAVGGERTAIRTAQLGRQQPQAIPLGQTPMGRR